MLAVVVAAIPCAIVARIHHVYRAERYHVNELTLARERKFGELPPPPEVERWHRLKIIEYREDRMCLEALAHVGLVTCMSLAGVAVVGRILHRMAWRSSESAPGAWSAGGKEEYG